VLNVLGALCFLGFLLAALLVALSERGWTSPRRRSVNAFLLYSVAVSFGAGFAQKDAWPFSRWPMAGGRADANASTTRIVAVDADGVERDVDFRAWQPVGFDELIPWMHRTFPRLPRDAQDRVARWLLEHAEAARRKAGAGEAIGSFHRVLGPLAAPEFDLHPRAWSPPAGAPPRPFVALRVYRESWNQEERRRDPARVTRRLVYESPR